jgi:ribose 5-phosphate isomerase B
MRAEIVPGRGGADHSMRLAIAADHAGYEMKRALVPVLLDSGHEVTDLGTDGPAPVDYPDYARALAHAVLSGGAERGILICGSGVGASVAVNKFSGIRAGLCHDTYSAHQGVEHDDMNVLVLGARVVGTALAADLVRAFVAATFSGDERHVRRLRKVMEIELSFKERS